MKRTSHLKRMTGLLLAIMMLISLLATGAAAATAPRTGSGLGPQTVTITEPVLRVRRGVIDNEEYYVDVESAGEELRDYLKNHEDGSVMYKVPCDGLDFSSLVHAIYAAAVVHTGDPQEGDAIRWATNGYYASGSGYSDGVYNYYTISYDVEYYTTPEQEQELTAAVDALIPQFGFTGSTTEYEKIKTVYDYVCGHVEYDYTNLENEAYLLKYTAYAAMIHGTSVCQGYALLMYRLLLEVGVDCRLISGIGNGGGHAWNIVKIGDLYYNIDSTWDAEWEPDGFFLRNDSEFDDHSRDPEYSTAEFNAEYPMSQCSYPHAYANGACTICGVADPNYVDYVYGDASGDGDITVRDLAMLRKYLANKDPNTEKSNVDVAAGADVNGDGDITVRDLAMLRKYLANKDPNTGVSNVVLGPR